MHLQQETTTAGESSVTNTHRILPTILQSWHVFKTSRPSLNRGSRVWPLLVASEWKSLFAVCTLLPPPKKKKLAQNAHQDRQKGRERERVLSSRSVFSDLRRARSKECTHKSTSCKPLTHCFCFVEESRLLRFLSPFFFSLSLSLSLCFVQQQQQKKGKRRPPPVDFLEIFFFCVCVCSKGRGQE